MATDGDKHDEIWAEFGKLVNMTPKQIEAWLDTDDSKAVGQKKTEDSESVGHLSGRRIIEIKGTTKSKLTDEQWAWMNKVNGYIKRHLAQKPHKDFEHTHWRYSLMNWGHDPLKD